MHPETVGDHAALAVLVAQDHDHHHEQSHEHPGHLNSHGHDHPHDHAHDVPAPSRRGLVAMGLAGGVLPSPSALLVFLGALALGHPWFGVALVVAFGLGMATTLAAVGLLVMRLRERAEQRLALRPRSRLAPLLRLAPMVTATAVVLLGAVLAWRGLAATELLGAFGGRSSP